MTSQSCPNWWLRHIAAWSAMTLIESGNGTNSLFSAAQCIMCTIISSYSSQPVPQDGLGAAASSAREEVLTELQGTWILPPPKKAHSQCAPDGGTSVFVSRVGPRARFEASPDPNPRIRHKGNRSIQMRSMMRAQWPSDNECFCRHK